MTDEAAATDLVAKAVAFATSAHEGQVDKTGHPYIGHPLRMLDRVRGAAARNIEAQVAAALHDVVEDCDVSLDDLRAEGFPETVVRAVDALSKRPGETLEQSIARVVADPIATIVKYADVADNTDQQRQALLDPQTRDRLTQKYRRTIELLDASRIG